MQKIVPQNLSSDQEIAKTQVIYTWEKDEIGFYFCFLHRDVYEVQFTGERWILPNKWGNDTKVYQYKYLNSSCPAGLIYKPNGSIDHGSEDEFFTTKEEAIECGLHFIEKQFDESINQHAIYLEKLMAYAGSLKLKITIIS